MRHCITPNFYMIIKSTWWKITQKFNIFTHDSWISSDTLWAPVYWLTLSSFIVLPIHFPIYFGSIRLLLLKVFSTTQFCVPYNHNYRVLCGNHLELSITEKIVFWLRKGQYNWLWNLNQPTFPTSQNFDCMMLSNLRLPQLITITVIFVLLGLICFHLKDWLFKFLRFKFCGDLCNLTDSQPFHFSRFPTN
jgi:hypothetical protein